MLLLWRLRSQPFRRPGAYLFIFYLPDHRIAPAGQCGTHSRTHLWGITSTSSNFSYARVKFPSESRCCGWLRCLVCLSTFSDNIINTLRFTRTSFVRWLDVERVQMKMSNVCSRAPSQSNIGWTKHRTTCINMYIYAGRFFLWTLLVNNMQKGWGITPTIGWSW